jgi:anti-sigma28 factor (negative regulator of flagellin synthesis)
MDEDRELRLAQLAERIRCGEYRVDPRAVADAIVRRLQERLSARPGRPPLQKECS